MAGRCPSDDMFAQCQAVNLQRDLPVTTPWGIQLPSNRSQRKWKPRVPKMAWPAWGLSAGGWLFRCEGMHHRQGPCQAVRRLLGLGDFVSFSSVFFQLGLTGRWGTCSALVKFSFIFPHFSAAWRTGVLAVCLWDFSFFNFFFLFGEGGLWRDFLPLPGFSGCQRQSHMHTCSVLPCSPSSFKLLLKSLLN